MPNGESRAVFQGFPDGNETAGTAEPATAVMCWDDTGEAMGAAWLRGGPFTRPRLLDGVDVALFVRGAPALTALTMDATTESIAVAVAGAPTLSVLDLPTAAEASLFVEDIGATRIALSLDGPQFALRELRVRDAPALAAIDVVSSGSDLLLTGALELRALPALTRMTVTTDASVLARWSQAHVDNVGDACDVLALLRELCADHVGPAGDLDITVANAPCDGVVFNLQDGAAGSVPVCAALLTPEDTCETTDDTCDGFCVPDRGGFLCAGPGCVTDGDCPRGTACADGGFAPGEIGVGVGVCVWRGVFHPDGETCAPPRLLCPVGAQCVGGVCSGGGGGEGEGEGEGDVVSFQTCALIGEPCADNTSTCTATADPLLHVCLVDAQSQQRSACTSDLDCGTSFVCSGAPVDGVCLAPSTLSGLGGSCSVAASGVGVDVVACASRLVCEAGICETAPADGPRSFAECANVNAPCTPRGGAPGTGFCLNAGRGVGSGVCAPPNTNREGTPCGPPGGGCNPGLECSTSPVFRLCFAPDDVGGVGAPCGVDVEDSLALVEPCAAGLVCDDPSFTCQPRDSDGDGVPDTFEASRGTNPNAVDSDGDGLCDGPRGVGCVPGEDLNANGVLDPGETDPLRPDSDCDGLSDGEEATSGTSALAADSDGDSIADGVELGRTIGAATGCGVIPSDLDLLTTTDPLDPDSDDDGFCDGPLTVPMVCVAGEDTNANGRVDGSESDPNNPVSTP